MKYSDESWSGREEELLSMLLDKVSAEIMTRAGRELSTKLNTVGSSRGDYPFVTVTTWYSEPAV